MLLGPIAGSYSSDTNISSYGYSQFSNPSEFRDPEVLFGLDEPCTSSTSDLVERRVDAWIESLPIFPVAHSAALRFQDLLNVLGDSYIKIGAQLAKTARKEWLLDVPEFPSEDVSLTGPTSDPAPTLYLVWVASYQASYPGFEATFVVVDETIYRETEIEKLLEEFETKKLFRCLAIKYSSMRMAPWKFFHNIRGLIEASRVSSFVIPDFLLASKNSSESSEVTSHHNGDLGPASKVLFQIQKQGNTQSNSAANSIGGSRGRIRDHIVPDRFEQNIEIHKMQYEARPNQRKHSSTVFENLSLPLYRRF